MGDDYHEWGNTSNLGWTRQALNEMLLRPSGPKENSTEKDMPAKKLIPLSEFEPQWKEGVNGEMVLKMWCPCGRKSRHRIRVPITTIKIETPWRRNGPSFEYLTVAPNIDTGCWTGFIEDGQVRSA